MRLAPIALPILLAACSLSGGDDALAADTGVTRTYAVAGFDAIALHGPDDVDVRVGSGFSIRAEGNAEVLDRLKVTRDGHALRIERRHEAGWNWSDRGPAKLLVTMPRIVAASVAGSGDIVVDRVDGARFDGTVAGSGNLNLGAMQVDTTQFAVSGSGDVIATGSADRLEALVRGSGNVRAGALKVKAATVSIAGSGNVRADLTGPGEVRIVGSGDVDLGRGARCRVTKVGSGSARCGG